MHRTIALLVALLALPAAAQLTPDTFTLTWNRGGVTALVNTNVYLSEVSYLLTNCVVYNGSVTQDLTSCGVQVRVGDSTTNRLFIGTVTDAINGKFTCLFTIPTKAASAARADTMTTGIQLTITNGAIYVTDREIKQLLYQQPLR